MIARGRRHLGRLLAAALTVALLALPVPAYADRSDEWRARAESAITAFAAADNGSGTAFNYAFALQTTAWLWGWDDPRVQPLLDKVYSLRKADGGWGLNTAYDALGDGTANPASTTYTITLSGHVGPVLLDAYLHGKIPKADIQTIVSLLMSTPRIEYNQQYGQCVAYSRNVNDDVSYGCVHNVNASVAWFLTRANAAGVQQQGLAKLIVDLVRRETFAYLPGPVTVNGRTVTSWWRYMDTTSLNDTDHNSYEIEVMYDLVPSIGGEGAWNHMNNALADNSAAPVAHVRLASLAARPGHMHPSGATWWCVLGDNWMAEFDTWMSGASLGRLAQGGYYAARAALAC